MRSSRAVKEGDILAGKYRVERLLGTGGMGYVFAARHLQLDQMVAMKFLRTDAAQSREATTRFLREAQAVARLQNEHIAKTHDVGALPSGEPYIVMEYLAGEDLATMTKSRPVLAASEACDYVIQACEALAEAHALGIVHRDIKLANLFVSRGPGGRPLVKVLDFGISKATPTGAASHEVTNAASLLGSPRFMSPEQMSDPRAVDGRTDVWSLGVVLYRLLCGRAPFEADTLARLVAMVMHEREARLTNLPRGLDAVVARCLEKDPGARMPDVGTLADALVPYCDDRTRARAAADRIAAVLARDGIDAAPATSKRASAPPPRESGTAAPWVTAPARSIRRRTMAPGLLALGVVAALAGSGLVKSNPRTATRTETAAHEAPLPAEPATLANVTLTAPPAPPPPPTPPTPLATASAPEPAKLRQSHRPKSATTGGFAHVSSHVDHVDHVERR